ncbi:MAG: hypothetical protein ACPGOY_06955 [Rhodospirillaceae bacterium]
MKVVLDQPTKIPAGWRVEGPDKDIAALVAEGIGTPVEADVECVREADRVEEVLAEEAPAEEADAALINAILALNQQDDSLWTKAGFPSVDALSAALKRPVGKDERDAAWLRIKEEMRSMYG